MELSTYFRDNHATFENINSMDGVKSLLLQVPNLFKRCKGCKRHYTSDGYKDEKGTLYKICYSCRTKRKSTVKLVRCDKCHCEHPKNSDSPNTI